MSGDSITAPSAISRRKRTARAASAQVEMLLTKLEAQPFLFTKKFTGFQARENHSRAWSEVADELNHHPNGAVKSTEQWMTVWRDLKSRACSKAAKLRKERVRTGNRGVNAENLTELERRVVSLIGSNYTFGSDCPDSMAEEDMLHNDTVAAESVIAQSLSNEDELRETILAIDSPPPATGNTLPAVVTPASTARQKILRRNRNLNRRQSVAEQHQSARRDFLAIAESNAESMRMLASAMQQQAEAAKVNSEAAKVQAEANVLFAQATAKIGEALVLLASNKNN